MAVTVKYITLTAVNKRVSISAYIKAVKVARANPAAEFKHGLTTWWPTTGAEIVKQFRTGMHDRINNGGHSAQQD